MRQEINEDHYEFSTWDLRHSSRCFITITNSEQWKNITGEHPPTLPPSAKDYTKAGLPWFDYYAADAIPKVAPVV
jgi:hypothetical protein